MVTLWDAELEEEALVEPPIRALAISEFGFIFRFIFICSCWCLFPPLPLFPDEELETVTLKGAGPDREVINAPAFPPWIVFGPEEVLLLSFFLGGS